MKPSGKNHRRTSHLSQTGLEPYGNLSAQRWVSARDNVRRTYTYAYDGVNRLTAAPYSAARTDGKTERYDLAGITYDANGNLTALQRYGLMGGTVTAPTAWGLMDNLTYTPTDNNRLTKVDDPATSPVAGVMEFKDRTGVSDYTYDDSGNLTKDDNENISSIQYNHLNLPRVLALTSPTATITHTYDAEGRKHRTVIGSSTTDYIQGLVYRNQKVEFVPTVEGRAVRNNSAYAYEYHLRDHLGNLRVAFRKSSEGTVVQRLTMEPQYAATEETQYEHVTDTRAAGLAYEGTHAARLRGETGPSRWLPVRAGERLRIDVMARYEGPEPKKRRLPLPVLLPHTNDKPGLERPTKWWQRWRLAGVLPLKRGRKKARTEVPTAHLRVDFYDEHRTLQHSRVVSLSREAAGAWQALRDSLQAPAAGYVHVQVANDDRRQAVYFDELQVSSEAPLLVQENHYDPWGVNLTGIETTGNPDHKWQYNGKEKQTRTEWYDYGARYYDPVIGRWSSVDPLVEITPELTGYRYGFNNPVRYTDFLGLWEKDQNGNYKTDKKEDIERYLTYVQAQTVNGSTTTQGEIERFISFEMAGGGDSYRLRNGSTLLFDGPTIKGNIENGKWKTSSLEWSILYPEQRYFDRWSYSSAYGGLAHDGLEEINSAPKDMWFGKNGKLYSGGWGGNQHTGSRTASMARTAKALKAVKTLGKGMLYTDIALSAVELDYNGWSNRGWAKVGVAVAIGTVSVATGGIGGIALGFALSAIDAHGGFDAFYEQFSNDPRFSVSNPNLQK